MKILELTNYSAGLCGVGARVKEEASRLSQRGHDVRIFSSNLTKGNKNIAPKEDSIEGVRITRFPTIKLGGESFMNWKFEKEAFDFRPDVIIAHAYRHVHTTRALKIGRKMGAKVFLVTHAPFVESKKTRSLVAKISVAFYDSFIGRSTLNKFNKVLMIAEWEKPFLKALGLKENKIEYVPNGIPPEFFTQKSASSTDKILFLGRISPIKDLETLIRAMHLIKDKKIELEIVGPAEEDYLSKLKLLVKSLDLQGRVIFSGPIYDVKEKIRKIDSCSIFVLPSLREGMPQSLIEAMARGKIVISSDNEGSRPLIYSGINGHLFKIGDAQELASKIDLSIRQKSQIGKKAEESVKKFSWDKIIVKLENIIKS